jgi:transcriptional regulator with XRE-family HTH domain
MPFHTHLRKLREARGLSCYRLAQLSGISQEGISKLEAEGCDPKLSTLDKLAGALGVSVAELVAEGSELRIAIAELMAGKKGMDAKQIADKLRPIMERPVAAKDVTRAFCDFLPTAEFPYRFEWIGTGDGEAAKYRVHKIKGQMVSKKQLSEWSTQLLPLLEELIEEAHRDRVEISLTHLCAVAGKIKKVLQSVVPSDRREADHEKPKQT